MILHLAPTPSLLLHKATRSAARDSAHARSQAWLNVSVSAVKADPSVANVKTLALSLKAGGQLQLDAAQLEAARQVFRGLADGLNGETDMDLVEVLVETADQAH